MDRIIRLADGRIVSAPPKEGSPRISHTIEPLVDRHDINGWMYFIKFDHKKDQDIETRKIFYL
jgi:hypothetical protein